MSAAITSILLGAAAKVGAPIIKNVLEKHVGGFAGTLAGTVVDQVAERLGVEPEAIPAASEEELNDAVSDIEVQMPELIAVYQQGLAGQFALLQAEQAEGFWPSAWRWGWMYLLAFFWICALLIFPIARAFGSTLETMDIATLMTLTGWFIGLYMGGHTVKELGRQAVDAVKTWRRIR
ncbi:hypothetical protein [Rhizobium rhizogenes]|uniref:Holin of 3TMs, for gene-transfer release n=1 Tax=Rhizobium rhizogenes TaxID=359 RepID=A0AA92HAD8_RHIRH|nr:hypothetical protein [Rhizobium rhizogenes]PVE56315.1 hypothetical protein DC430_00450 [Rhizobium rhizogenes]PVE64810.1 hypothetical protein DC415_13650 [Agrobacterium tumefaciens]PVE73948.1 hypothetical protein DCP16_13650 [Sphingomonas sp. TPD3009]